MNVTIVPVECIAEYPTQLGDKCKVLKKLGLDPYTNTEEELMSVLIETATQPEYLEICKTSCRCAAFYREYQQGKTLFLEDEPIKLIEYNGRYWVHEGKHRVCAAKRFKVATIQAKVTKESVNRMLLPEKTERLPFERSFVYEYNARKKEAVRGEYAILWVEMPFGMPSACSDYYPCIIDISLHTDGEWREILSGICYRTTINPKRTGFFGFGCQNYFQTTVKIEPNHKNTRIWLCSVKVDEVYKKSISQFTTQYRSGLWRGYHNQAHAVHRQE